MPVCWNFCLSCLLTRRRRWWNWRSFLRQVPHSRFKYGKKKRLLLREQTRRRVNEPISPFFKPVLLIWGGRVFFSGLWRDQFRRSYI